MRLNPKPQTPNLNIRLARFHRHVNSKNLSPPSLLSLSLSLPLSTSSHTHTHTHTHTHLVTTILEISPLAHYLRHTQTERERACQRKREREIYKHIYTVLSMLQAKLCTYKIIMCVYDKHTHTHKHTDIDRTTERERIRYLSVVPGAFVNRIQICICVYAIACKKEKRSARARLARATHREEKINLGKPNSSARWR
jgi:hypothetical protein